MNFFFSIGYSNEVANTIRAVYRNFAKGGRNWGMDKRGGARRAEAQWYHVRCYTLGGGARMTQGGANAAPPLKYGPEPIVNWWAIGYLEGPGLW